MFEMSKHQTEVIKMKGNNKKNLISLWVLVGIFAFISTGYALDKPTGGGKSAGHLGDYKDYHESKKKMVHEVIHELGLTKDQHTTIDKQRTLQQDASKDLWKKMHAKREALRNELNKWESDEKKINQLVQEMAKLRNQLLQNRISGIFSIKKILTKEQFEELVHKLEIKKEAFKESHKAH